MAESEKMEKQQDPKAQPDESDEMELLVAGGIAEYMNPDGKPFSGRIKESADDFVVNEISIGGELVTLTDEELEADKIPTNFYIPPPLENKKSKKAAKEQNLGGEDFFLQWSQGDLESIIAPDSLGPIQEFARQQEEEPPAVGLKPDKRPSCIVCFLRPTIPPTSAAASDDPAEQERLYRRFCHRSLQIRWPWMKTSTVPAGGGSGGGSSIRVSYDEFFDPIRGLLNAEDLRHLQSFIITSKDATPPGGAPPCVWLGRGADKALRTRIHQCIARTMGFLQSTTDTTGGGTPGDDGAAGDEDAAAPAPAKAEKGGGRPPAANALIKVTRKPGKAAR
jgi:hypothetical protein